MKLITIRRIDPRPREYAFLTRPRAATVHYDGRTTLCTDDGCERCIKCGPPQLRFYALAVHLAPAANVEVILDFHEMDEETMPDVDTIGKVFTVARPHKRRPATWKTVGVLGWPAPIVRTEADVATQLAVLWSIPRPLPGETWEHWMHDAIEHQRRRDQLTRS